MLEKNVSNSRKFAHMEVKIIFELWNQKRKKKVRLFTASP